MKIEQKYFNKSSGWVSNISHNIAKELYQIVFVFGNGVLLKNSKLYDELREMYPQAHIIFVSDAGQIAGTIVFDNSVVVTAVYFEKSSVQVVSESIAHQQESFEVGRKLSLKLEKKGLQHGMIFSEGIRINGSQLIEGVKSILGNNVNLSGGLAGDDMNFGHTYVSLNQTPNEEGKVVLVGFYGENLKVGLGSIGGWDIFGITRTITKSKGNILYEIDGQPVLDLYKTYLGELAEDLPASGLLFPLGIKGPDGNVTIVRTLLGINESDKSITFAGDVPEGYQACLMKANFERIIDGAGKAAEESILGVENPELALLVSCVGRKAVLKQRIEEEVENAAFVIGGNTVISGFYSYGEIAPSGDISHCYLHNQTMTITLFQEK